MIFFPKSNRMVLSKKDKNNGGAQRVASNKEEKMEKWTSPTTGKTYSLDSDGTVTVAELCEFYAEESAESTSGAACEVCPHREWRWAAEPLPSGLPHCWCDVHQHNI